MGKILTAINNQLDKAKDFRYFALLGSFVLFADALSILILNTALIDIGYKQLTQEINFGGILICFTLFAFFVSFFVPLFRYILIYLSFLAPHKVLFFFEEERWGDVKPIDYFYMRDLKEFSVRNNNSVAFKYYEDIAGNESKTQQLYHYSLSFLLATIFNTFSYTKNSDALASTLLRFFNSDNSSLSENIAGLTIITLYIFIFYSEIIKGCGISTISRGKYYFRKNKFRDPENSHLSNLD